MSKKYNFLEQQKDIIQQFYSEIEEEIEEKYRKKYQKLSEYFDILSRRAEVGKTKKISREVANQISIRAFTETRDYLKVIQALTKETQVDIVHRLVEAELDRLML